MFKGFNRDLFLRKQIEHDTKQQSYLIQGGSLRKRRLSQEDRMPPVNSGEIDSIKKLRGSNSVHVDQEIQTKSYSPAIQKWKKMTDKIPRRVLLNYQEIMKPNELQFNLSQPRIHSPEQNQRKFQKSFYLNYLEGKSSHRKPNLNLTNSLVQIQDKTQELSTQKISKPYRVNYIFHYIVGSGGFGKVWKVESKKTRIIYAMKELSKAKVLAKKSVKSVLNEKTLLNRLRHPFLVNMVAAFQDRDNLYLVMDYLSGGDLRYHLIINRTFREEQIKFLMACLILGLEYMHLNNVIHRDIKPENLVLDCKGYLRITDLGIARIARKENSNETSGTPGYMAPEILLRQNHSFGVDHFALGVIAYEMITGRRPYQGRTRKEIRDEIISKQVQINHKDYLHYSKEIIEFVNKLIQRKACNRLGYGGTQELKNHGFFENYMWDKLYQKTLNAPFLPRQDTSSRQIKFEEESMQSEIAEHSKQLRMKEIQILFQGYTYYTESTKY